MSDLQWSSIGSDNGLAPKRQQAIIWTIDGLGWYCINVSLTVTQPQWVKQICLHVFKPTMPTWYEVLPQPNSQG